MMRILALLALVVLATCQPKPLPTSNWRYIQIDDQKVKWGDFEEPQWLRYFGLDAADLNNDGYKDVVSGRNVYLNPGGDMTDEWQKIDLGKNVDAMISVDVNNNGRADIIAEALPDVYWFEATDKNATKWTAKIVAQIPPTSHHNGQGYQAADIIPGGKIEILLSSQQGIYLLEIPKKNDGEEWNVSLIGANATDEGLTAADIDNDGDLDIAGGRRAAGNPEPTLVVWFENPGDATVPWKDFKVGETEHPCDRVELADFDGDGLVDLAVGEERYPGLEPDANMYVFFQKNKTNWERKTIVTQYSMNNLDVADIDKDGDIDISTSEHKGSDLALQLWLNDGSGNFTKYEIDRGKEAHLGARFYDMDNDGDMDIISSAWDHHYFMHLWRNEAIKK
jgi:hypothetical protein